MALLVLINCFQFLRYLRVDIINFSFEELVRLGYESPVFRTLDDIAEQEHAAAEGELHERIERRLNDSQRQSLDMMLETQCRCGARCTTRSSCQRTEDLPPTYGERQRHRH